LENSSPACYQFIDAFRKFLTDDIPEFKKEEKEEDDDDDVKILDDKYQILEKLVASDSSNPGEDKIVSLEQFAHFINWFGPISPTKKGDFLDDVKYIWQKNGFMEI